MVARRVVARRARSDVRVAVFFDTVVIAIVAIAAMLLAALPVINLRLVPPKCSQRQRRLHAGGSLLLVPSLPSEAS